MMWLRCFTSNCQISGTAYEQTATSGECNEKRLDSDTEFSLIYYDTSDWSITNDCSKRIACRQSLSPESTLPFLPVLESSKDGEPVESLALGLLYRLELHGMQQPVQRRCRKVDVILLHKLLGDFLEVDLYLLLQ